MHKMSRFAISLLVVSFLSAGGITGALVMVNASPDTTIAISPASQSVGVGDTFTVDVNVDPDQPIRGVQCYLTFDSSMLQAQQVTEGDIFSGYTTFFIGGTINNTAGEIRGIASTILGAGNTTAQGTFATVTFEAVAAGTATIDFNMSDGNTVVVTGDSQTIEPTPTDATVTIISGNVAPDKPVNPSPGDGATGVSTSPSLEVDVSDPNGDMLDVTFYDDSDDSVIGMDSNVPSGGTASVTWSGLSVSTLYSWYAVADDGALTNTSATWSFTTSDEDTVPPTIRDVTVSPSTAEAGENVVITANVTDDLSLADVRLAITYPDDSTENVSIFQNVSGIEEMTYYRQQPYYDLGNYTFYIYAVDDAGNGNTSQEKTFTVQDTTPPAFSNVAATPAAATYNAAVNLSATVTDAVGVTDVFLKIINPDDDVTNTSIFEQMVNDTYYSETSYTTLGTYEYSFYAVDGEGNGNTSSIKTFKVEDVTPPQVTLTAPNGGENISGDVDITWNATDTATANDSDLEVTLKYSADEGVSWQTIVADTANDGTYEWDTDGLDDGTEYLLKISVSDPSNNDGTDISDAVFTVDNTAPALTLEKPTANNLYLFDREILPVLRAKAVIVGQITVSVTASDATSGMDRVSFLVDGVEKASDETAPYEWVWDDTVLFSHTLKIVAYDNAGNRAEQSVSVSVYNI